MTGTAFLWQADGPEQGARGVSGELGKARLRAESFLRSGAATAAVVEAATPELEADTLADSYRCTGEAWLAEAAPGGGIIWVPVSAELAAP